MASLRSCLQKNVLSVARHGPNRGIKWLPAHDMSGSWYRYCLGSTARQRRGFFHDSRAPNLCEAVVVGWGFGIVMVGCIFVTFKVYYTISRDVFGKKEWTNSTNGTKLLDLGINMIDLETRMSKLNTKVDVLKYQHDLDTWMSKLNSRVD
jgi:hypothetical protein